MKPMWQVVVEIHPIRNASVIQPFVENLRIVSEYILFCGHDIRGWPV